MTAKEKAKLLFNEMYQATPFPKVGGVSPDDNKRCAKLCALIAANTAAKTLWNAGAGGKVNVKDSDENIEYWFEVKEEINYL